MFIDYWNVTNVTNVIKLALLLVKIRLLMLVCWRQFLIALANVLANANRMLRQHDWSVAKTILDQHNYDA